MNVLPEQASHEVAGRSLAFMQLEHSQDLQAVILIALSVMTVTLADRIVALMLGATTVFLGPGNENLGLGVAFIFLPIIVFALPLSFAGASFFARPTRLSLLTVTVAARAFIPLTASIWEVRQLLAGSQSAVGITLSLIFLLGQITLATTLVQLRGSARRPLPYLCAMIVGFFLGQWGALNLAPYLVSQPASASFNACLVGLYIVGVISAHYGFKSLEEFKLRDDLARAALYLEDEHVEMRPWQLARFLAATVALYLPLFAPLFVTLLFAIEGNQAGTQMVSSLSAALSLACAIGAALSIFLNRLARKRIILQVIAIVAVSLYVIGSLSHTWLICYSTLTAMAAIAGLILPDWYHHLLTHLSQRQLPHFLAAKDTILIAVYALSTIPVEQSLAVVSGLYFLKELNLLGAVLTLVAIVIAPFVLKK